MPGLFPELFNFSFLAPFILRIALGVPLIKHGFGKIIAPQEYFHFSNRSAQEKLVAKESAPQRILGGIVFLSGIFLVIGLFTQAAAIAVSLIIIASSIIMGVKLPRSWTERLIKLAIAVTLILTGPGMFAFDLPL